MTNQVEFHWWRKMNAIDSITAKEMVIERIVDGTDRVLLYGKKRDYYLIASHKAAKEVRLGDIVLYKPFGSNFGWFLEKKL